MPLRDIPLITATNVLKQLTDTLHDRALALTDGWAEPENSHVYRYLLRLLYGGSTRAGADESASHEAAEPASAPVDDPLTAELRGIFDRISQKEQSRAAIRELYEFQLRHPEKQPSIERSLQKTGPIFQRYIKRALANHAAEDAQRQERHAPPPPAAPPAPSPALTSVDARLAELKAKFRKEPSGRAPAPDKLQKRMSVSTEALRSRLAAMRTDEPQAPQGNWRG